MLTKHSSVFHYTNHKSVSMGAPTELLSIISLIFYKARENYTYTTVVHTLNLQYVQHSPDSLFKRFEKKNMHLIDFEEHYELSIMGNRAAKISTSYAMPGAAEFLVAPFLHKCSYVL